MSAILSDDGRFRFALTRRVNELGTGQLCWIMFNPSTADDTEDDPTIRRVADFTRRWGFRSLIVVNLLPIRATDPAEARRWAQETPVTDLQMWAANRLYVEAAGRTSKQVVAAWGVLGGPHTRDAIDRHGDQELWALGFNENGQPKHPLYVAKTTKLQRWEDA